MRAARGSGWRRFASGSYEELGNWVLVWVVVFVLLGAFVYCVATAQALCSAGALACLGGLVRVAIARVGS
jgi:hypothetical protein